MLCDNVQIIINKDYMNLNKSYRFLSNRNLIALLSIYENGNSTLVKHIQLTSFIHVFLDTHSNADPKNPSCSNDIISQNFCYQSHRRMQIFWISIAPNVCIKEIK